MVASYIFMHTYQFCSIAITPRKYCLYSISGDVSFSLEVYIAGVRSDVVFLVELAKLARLTALYRAYSYSALEGEKLLALIFKCRGKSG